MNVKHILAAGVILAIGGGAYAAWRYYKQQKDLLEKYKTDLIGIKVLSYTNNLITLQFVIRITNVSDVEATIKKVYSDVYLNNEYQGYLTSDQNTVIPANGSNDITVQFSTAPKALLKNLVDVVLSAISQKDVPYRLKGYVSLSSGNIITLSVPFDYSGSVKDDML